VPDDTFRQDLPRRAAALQVQPVGGSRQTWPLVESEEGSVGVRRLAVRRLR
jgi:hypothetical protein